MQNSAFFILLGTFKPLQFLFSLLRSHSTINVLGFNIFFGVCLLNHLKSLYRIFRQLYALAKRNRTVHLFWVNALKNFFIRQGFFMQSIYAAYYLQCGIWLNCIIFYLCHNFRIQLVLFHCQNYNFVIRKQIFPHRLAKTYSIKFLAIKLCIIHRTQNSFHIFGFVFCSVCVYAWRGSHIQSFFAFQKPIIVYLCKIRFIFIQKFYACCSVGFIANNYIKFKIHFFLQLLNLANRLVSWKNNNQTAVLLLLIHKSIHIFRQSFAIGSCGV